MLFCSARDLLLSAVQPLLNLIGSYSGCYVTLIAMALDDANGEPYFSTSVGSPVPLSPLLTPQL